VFGGSESLWGKSGSMSDYTAPSVSPEQARWRGNAFLARPAGATMGLYQPGKETDRDWLQGGIIMEHPLVSPAIFTRSLRKPRGN
jgi:hypothetical protein